MEDVLVYYDRQHLFLFHVAELASLSNRRSRLKSAEDNKSKHQVPPALELSLRAGHSFDLKSLVDLEPGV